MAAREHQQLERPLAASPPAADNDDAAYNALHDIARQLIHDNDQVIIYTYLIMSSQVLLAVLLYCFFVFVFVLNSC